MKVREQWAENLGVWTQSRVFGPIFQGWISSKLRQGGYGLGNEQQKWNAGRFLERKSRRWFRFKPWTKIIHMVIYMGMKYLYYKYKYKPVCLIFSVNQPPWLKSLRSLWSLNWGRNIHSVSGGCGSLLQPAPEAAVNETSRKKDVMFKSFNQRGGKRIRISF